MKKINKKITTINRTVYSNRKIDYIVIHWVGAISNAKNNAQYFYTGYRAASAHYFVDDTSIWQSVNDKDAAWAVGSNGLMDQGSAYAKYGGKYYGKCTNANSISIEMCCVRVNGKTTISTKTINNTAELVQYLMKKYNIPESRVIRHFDVNGKLCPGTHIKASDWASLKKKLVGEKTTITNSTSKNSYTGTYPVLPSKGYLEKGDSGLQVERLQMFLNWCIGAGLKVDASFGTATLIAVKNFQKKYGLTVDGYFGEKTLAKAKTIKK